jgi:hypothetical protein
LGFRIEKDVEHEYRVVERQLDEDVPTEILDDRYVSNGEPHRSPLNKRQLGEGHSSRDVPVEDLKDTVTTMSPAVRLTGRAQPLVDNWWNFMHKR